MSERCQSLSKHLGEGARELGLRRKSSLLSWVFTLVFCPFMISKTQEAWAPSRRDLRQPVTDSCVVPMVVLPIIFLSSGYCCILFSLSGVHKQVFNFKVKSEVTLKVWEIPFPWLRLDTISFSPRAFWNVGSQADRQCEQAKEGCRNVLAGECFSSLSTQTWENRRHGECRFPKYLE